jgi:uncharacterized membrane protein
MRDKMIEKLSLTALFVALVFLGTFTFKIPAPFGYMHLGDCMILLAVLILGGKRGAVAGAIGAGLADIISGYAVWFIPTVICKSLMALSMGYIISKKIFRLKGRVLWMTGAVFGGVLQSIGYTITRIIFYGTAPAIASIPLLLVQTGLGIIFAFVLSEALQKTALRKVFLYTTDSKGVNQSC